eukprot:8560032-Pyramimonas_sp.AAC.1
MATTTATTRKTTILQLPQAAEGMFTAVNHFQPRMLTNSRKKIPLSLGRIGSVVQRNTPNI